MMASELHLPVALAIALLLLLASTPASSGAGGHADPHNERRTIVIKWRYGFDYETWAKDTDFQVDNTLVFVYAEEGDNTRKYPEHRVDLMKNQTYMATCQFGWFRSTPQGIVKEGKNVSVRLSQTKGYFFASASRDDCSKGKMKFPALIQHTPRPATGSPWVSQLLTGLVFVLLLILFALMACIGRLRGLRGAVIKKKPQ